MSAMCDDTRAAELAESLAEQRRMLEAAVADLERVRADLDALKARLRRGFGQVIADGDHKR